VVPQLASQMTISGVDLNARPYTFPGELLEAAPGLAVIQHSGSGKANQFYLRGWNLDHGTDLATFLGRHTDQLADTRPRAGLHRSQLSHS